MTGLYVILGIIALLAVIVIGIYNGLVAKRQQCRQAFADVDVQLKQRRNLIPNLVETVKGYASHERETLDAVIEMQVDDEALVARITARSTCGGCGEVYNDQTKPWPEDGKCSNCGSTDVKRRADDNEDSLRTRLMEYYKKTSPLIGYYYAKGDLSSINGLGAMAEVKASIDGVLDA